MAQLLSAVTPGTLVQLNENGSPAQFYVAAQNYESGLNGAGRTLLVRKDVYQNGRWNVSGANTYANSTIDQWFNGTYKSLLDPWVQTAIGTTTFYYTPGNGNNTVTTLSRAVFALSITEIGLSYSTANIEGSALPIASSLKIAYRNGNAVTQWTRTPRKNYEYDAIFVNEKGGSNTLGVINSAGYRPCFTLPGTLYVWDDGTVSQYAGPAPASITTPALIMTGNSIPISWDGVSGADSYILQRKVDSGEWTQVYDGSGTAFTDTAGSWSTVQYQVCGVFDGTNGAFAQSDVITVVPTSTLVISGQDGSLGTITSDIPYSVATDTGNQIALTRTVNGALVASLTVNSSFAYNIPVMDLPTGTGTIVITATVQTSSDPVTVTRTWTYTKAAQTFPTSGGLAQLTQDGQNVFPLTLAEAVKAIGGPWGGNLSTALDKLATAAVFNREVTPKYTEVKVDLSKVQPGDIVNLPENGVMVPFYVASLDYEPTLNTGGTRVLLVRKDVYQNGQWNSTNVNAYAGSTIDTWFNSTYLPMLDSTVQAQVGTTTFYYTPGNGNNTVTTLSRAVFALSGTELGQSIYFVNTEGTELPAASALILPSQWIRSPNKTSTNQAGISANNASQPIQSHGVTSALFPYRPCFTLPATFQATYYVDSNGGIHASQEYTTAGDFADLWGNIIPTVKIETGSYTGTGTYGADNPNTLTFTTGTPILVVAGGGTYTAIFSCFQGSGTVTCPLFYLTASSSSLQRLICQPGENSISWWTLDGNQNQQLNVSGSTVNYLAILV